MSVYVKKRRKPWNKGMRKRDCRVCKGKGWRENAGALFQCSFCNGTGKRWVKR